MKRYNPAVSFIQDTKTHMAYMKEYKHGDYVRLDDLEPIKELLDELIETAEYWSEYDVPLGLHDRIKEARELLD